MPPEYAPGMLDLDTESQAEIRCKSGRPIPLVDLRIVDEEMCDLIHDGQSTGEVVVRAPWLTQGYFKDPENSETLLLGPRQFPQRLGQIAADGS